MQIVHLDYCICNNITAMQLKVPILQVNNDCPLHFNEEVTSSFQQYNFQPVNASGHMHTPSHARSQGLRKKPIIIHCKPLVKVSVE